MLVSNQQKRYAFHECGHALIATLYIDDFIVEKITLDPQRNLTNIVANDWGGGIHIRPTETTKANPTLDQKENILIIQLGGIIGQTIFRDGLSTFRQNIESYLNGLSFNSIPFDNRGCKDDIQFVIDYLREQANSRNIDPLVYYKKIFSFAMQYLTNEKVWKMIETLAAILLTINYSPFCRQIKKQLYL